MVGPRPAPFLKPAPKRKYGYYCLPVLAGDQLVARVDLKADWKAKKLHLLSVLLEEANMTGKANSKYREAVRTALERFSTINPIFFTGWMGGEYRPDAAVRSETLCGFREDMPGSRRIWHKS